jgi:hypothetical protein
MRAGRSPLFPGLDCLRSWYGETEGETESRPRRSDRLPSDAKSCQRVGTVYGIVLIGERPVDTTAWNTRSKTTDLWRKRVLIRL